MYLPYISQYFLGKYTLSTEALPKKCNKNISLTDRRQRLIENSLFYIANIEDT